MKDQNSINETILAAEQELAALDAKRTVLQDRVRQLKGLNQSIADEQLSFSQRSESNVTNEMNQWMNKRLLFFGPCSEVGKMSIQGALKASDLVKAVTSRSAEKSGSGLFVKNPKSNAVIVKTGILRHYRMMSFETVNKNM